MKRIKALIATLSLLFVLTTVFVPNTYATANGDDQGTAQPATPTLTPEEIMYIILVALGLIR